MEFFRGVSEIPSDLFHFLAVKQTKYHIMIFIPDPKIKQLASSKIMGKCRVVWDLFGFDTDFVSSSGGSFSNFCSLENVHGYMVSLSFFLFKSWLLEACYY